MNNKKNYRVIFFLLLFFFIVIIFLTNIIQKQKTIKRDTKKNGQLTPSPKMKKELGSFKLMPKNNQSVISKDQPFTLVVLADSAGQPVTGYDLVFILEEEKISFLSQKNLHLDFQLFLSQKGQQLNFTGIKKTTTTNPVIFQSDPLIEISFNPKKTGRVDFNLLFEKGSKKESNLINEKNEEILTKVEGTTFFIGEKFILEKNQPLNLETTNLSLVLTEVDLPDKHCRDCLSFARVVVTKEGQTKSVDFETGGIAGLINDEGEAFGLGMKLLKFNTEQIELILFPK